MVYLHTHHGSRMEGAAVAAPLLERGFSLCLFDFQGYGHSDGDSVTLGIREAEQVQAVLQHLRTLGKSQLVLWGRSMGAVAAVLFLTRHSHEVSAAVLDSPFSSLSKLITELIYKKTMIPPFINRLILHLAEDSLHRRGLDLSKLELEPLVASIVCPVVFLASKNDDFVDIGHTTRLYEQVSGKKKLVFID